jgi:hypothetical protein
MEILSQRWPHESLDIHFFLDGLFVRNPDWDVEFPFFRPKIIKVIQFCLVEPSVPASSVVSAVKSIRVLPHVSQEDAGELSSLLLRYLLSLGDGDTDGFENSVITSLSLFKNFPEKIPVRFVLELMMVVLRRDAAKTRRRCVKAFSQLDPKYMSQPDIFAMFSKFFVDESADVRKAALNAVQKLKIIDAAFMRTLLLSTLQSIRKSFNIKAEEAPISWTVLPHVIAASKSILPLYAKAICNICLEMLKATTIETRFRDPMLMYMQSTVKKDVEESLIKSLTQCALLSQRIVSVQPILKVFLTIMDLPVHPWTKENVLKSLKNFAEVFPVNDLEPGAVPILLETVRKRESMKLVAKTLKVLGCIGVIHSHFPPKKNPLFFKTSLVGATALTEHFIAVLFGSINRLLQSTPISRNRSNITKTVCKIFELEPNVVPIYLDKIINLYLAFIESSDAALLPEILESLKDLIRASRSSVLGFSEVIFSHLERTWDICPVEAANVFENLVAATEGECESILDPLILKAFHVLNESSTNSDRSLSAIVDLLAIIVEHHRTCITAVLDKLIRVNQRTVDIRKISHCINLIQRICDKPEAAGHYQVIARWLRGVRQCPSEELAVRARDTFFWITNGCPSRGSTPARSRRNDISQSNLGEFCKFLQSLRVCETTNHQDWISTIKALRRVTSTHSPIPVMSLEVVGTLPSNEFTFVFPFTFLSMWNDLSSEQREIVSQKLEPFYRFAPKVVFRDVVRILEFLILSELPVRTVVSTPSLLNAIINRCIDFGMLGLALFFLENLYEGDEEVVKLIDVNLAENRVDEAQALASQVSTHKLPLYILTKLGRWDEVIKTLPSTLTEDHLICLAALDQWDTIFEKCCKFDKATEPRFAKYLWKASLLYSKYLQNREGYNAKALGYVKRTGGWTVDECIQKAYLYIRIDNLDKAKRAVHKGWRYLASKMSAEEKHDNSHLSDYIFQAIQLHDLSDVTHVKLQSEAEESQSWRRRLRSLADDPEKLEILFRIRTLYIDPQDEAEFVYRILASIQRGRRDRLNHIIKLFFAEGSDHYRYCELRFMLDKSESLRYAQDLLTTLKGEQSERVVNRLHRYLGKENFQIGNLEKALVHFQVSYKPTRYIAMVQTHLAFHQTFGSADQAVIAAKALDNCIQHELTPYIACYHLMALLLRYPDSEIVAHVIHGVFLTTPITVLRTIHAPLVGELIRSGSHLISKICLILLTNAPYSIVFDLLFQNSSRVCKELLDEYRSVNSVTYSQITVMHSRMISLVSTVYDRTHALLKKVKGCLEKGKMRQCRQAMEELKAILTEPAACQFDTHFRSLHKEKLASLIEHFRFSAGDLPGLEAFIPKVSRDFISGVIQLKHLDEQLVEKSDWQIPVIGHEDKFDLKMNRFLQTAHRFDDGIQVVILGSNGKKYPFDILRKDPQGIVQSEQFTKLINTIIPSPVTQREVIPLTNQVVLFEILKGNVKMVDLVNWYLQSNSSHIPEPKLPHQIGPMLARKDKRLELRNALLTSSRNARSWMQRTTNFSKSMGSLAAVAYLIEGVKLTPSGMLMDRTTGAVTSTKFIVLANVDPPVPFRLTRMIEAAFGRCGVNGPFRASLTASLMRMQKYAKALAPVVQFGLLQPMSAFAQLPPNEESNNEIDVLYRRIEGRRDDVNGWVQGLIDRARSPDQWLEMPMNWKAWW